MKKIYIILSVLFIFDQQYVYAIDYDKIEKICKNKGLTIDKSEYWKCIDEQKEIINTYKPNSKSKLNDQTYNNRSNNINNRSSYYDK